ncbi:MAG: guanylate kinase [candidate division WOR-3 bacterium]|nr:guanylate kinase [candidate division WOR-3 bacterium]MCX7947966.1 guanylate kinase [candidate division WOR-3 bacterium]MDW8150910.1 guanylate kinase [candidate division WOR-3 bacterium]
MKYQNFIIIISGPSGSGKTTICKELLKLDRSLFYSVSVTTRLKRKNEIDGLDYIFISEDKFLEMVKSGEFLEWAEIYGKFYGTLKRPILEQLSKNKDIIMDIDVQGKRNIERNFSGRVVSIFLIPPSKQVLIERLRRRADLSEEELEKRIALLDVEMNYRWEYDYWVVNDNLDETILNVKKIIDAERMRGRFTLL